MILSLVPSHRHEDPGKCFIYNHSHWNKIVILASHSFSLSLSVDQSILLLVIMFLLLFYLLIFAFVQTIVALPLPIVNSRQSSKTTYFLLVGDSTTAKSKELSYGIAGGWIEGFLALLSKPASGVNYGHQNVILPIIEVVVTSLM